MEPLFINQFNLTFEMYQEWAAHPVGKTAIQVRKKGIILRCILAFCGISIMILAMMMRDIFYMILGVAFLFIAIGRLFFLGKLILKKQYKYMLRAQNSDSHIRKTTFADEILCEVGNSTTRYSYSEIIKLTEDERYFYLFYNEDMVLRIYKTGFILGNAKDFRHFINSKMSENKQ